MFVGGERDRKRQTNRLTDLQTYRQTIRKTLPVEQRDGQTDRRFLQHYQLKSMNHDCEELNHLECDNIVFNSDRQTDRQTDRQRRTDEQTDRLYVKHYQLNSVNHDGDELNHLKGGHQLLPPEILLVLGSHGGQHVVGVHEDVDERVAET